MAAIDIRRCDQDEAMDVTLHDPPGDPITCMICDQEPVVAGGFAKDDEPRGSDRLFL